MKSRGIDRSRFWGGFAAKFAAGESVFQKYDWELLLGKAQISDICLLRCNSLYLSDMTEKTGDSLYRGSICAGWRILHLGF